MKQIKIMVLSKRKIIRSFLLLAASIISIYLLFTLYFMNHFFFHTEMNGIDVSLKAHNEITDMIDRFIQNYELQLIERDGETEVITSQDIGMQFNKNAITHIKQMQIPFLWMGSLFHNKRYYVKELFKYNKALFDHRINELKCLNNNMIESQNVDFEYSHGCYEMMKEKYGNKIQKDPFIKAIDSYILSGKTKLDLNKVNCYENPKYTVASKKAIKTKNLLNKYVATRIIYQFGSAIEQLDGDIINKWLHVDDNLEVVISKQAVAEYIRSLSKKYDTVGIEREFQASTGKKIKLKGGLYGWKIDRDAETEAIFQHIQQGDTIKKEPIYLQKAFSREGNEIGDTYVEINITRQHLWFYKDGKLIVEGPVVTGNPNRGYATVLGVYMVNYKQKGATLTGPGYEAKVTYWMPFFGNIGLHDASWRYRFGREIYKRNGSHGCVNAPYYLAKMIYEKIEEGTPVILYEEEYDP